MEFLTPQISPSGLYGLVSNYCKTASLVERLIGTEKRKGEENSTAAKWPKRTVLGCSIKAELCFRRFPDERRRRNGAQRGGQRT